MSIRNLLVVVSMVAALSTSAATIRQDGATLKKDGIAVDLSMTSVRDNDVEVRFSITNAESGAPITGLNPIAWLDRQTTDRGTAASTADSCKAKVKSFLGGSLQARPEADLNKYAIITLNRDGTVAVIDPLQGFGGSKLLALVLLGAEGADWSLTPDQQTLFVSVPSLNEVVVVDTQTWKIATRVTTGRKPQRMALQPDAGYLWVATDEGVSVIDVVERRSVAGVQAAGKEFAFSRDSRYAFVAGEDRVSVVDVHTLKHARTIEAAKPVTLAYSQLSNAVYAGLEDGTVLVIDASSLEVRSRVATKAGLRSVGFSRDGRWGFILNPAANLVNVLDSSSNAIVQNITVAGAPDKVSFTELYAYIRAAGSEEVSMIRLSTVEGGKQPAISRFQGGQTAPEYASGPALPAEIVPAPESGAVLVSNPADKTVYYYSEGMAAPMGSFQNYRREPLGVLAVNRNLREVKPGVYATTVRLAKGGRFDIPFVLDSPRMTQCFDYSVELPSDRLKGEEKALVKLERLFAPGAQAGAPNVQAGAPMSVRVRLVDGKTGKPLPEIKDLRVLTFTPGRHQTRAFARPLGDGVYEATVVPPHAGVYYVFFESGSLGKTYRQLPHWVVTATEKKDS